MRGKGGGSRLGSVMLKKTGAWSLVLLLAKRLPYVSQCACLSNSSTVRQDVKMRSMRETVTTSLLTVCVACVLVRVEFNVVVEYVVNGTGNVVMVVGGSAGSKM